MIETTVLSYLASSMNLPVYLEEPESPPEKYVIVEKVGSAHANRFDSAMIAVQSYDVSLLKAAELSHMIKQIMHDMPEQITSVTRCVCTGDYNYTDTETHRYRYQAVFDISYYEE